MQRRAPGDPTPPEPIGSSGTIPCPWLVATRREKRTEPPIYDALFEYPVFDPTAVQHAGDLNILIDCLVLRHLQSVRAEQLYSRPPADEDRGFADESDLSGSFEVLLQTSDLVSIRFQVYYCSRGAAHPSHSTDVINFQPAAGVQLWLSDVFQRPEAALAVLRSDCAAQLGLTPDDPFYEGLDPDHANYRCFNITRDGLLFTFREYQVAPYVAGEPSLTIPWQSLVDLLNPSCAVSRFAASQRA